MMKTQRIVIAGDIHGCFRALDQAIKYFEPDSVLQCGDFGIWPWTDMDKIVEGFRAVGGRRVPVHFCDGNHEHHQTLRMFRECTSPPFEVGREVYYQPRGSTITLPNGRIVLFAGGAYSVDKDQRTPGTDWFPEEILTEDDFASFPDIPSVYMVISHAAPMSATLPPGLFPTKYPDPSRRVLDKVLRRYQPKRWYCGHYHVPFSEKLGECEFRALDCGHDFKCKSDPDLAGYAVLEEPCGPPSEK